MSPAASKLDATSEIVPLCTPSIFPQKLADKRYRVIPDFIARLQKSGTHSAWDIV